jgi:hypothetical protein
MSHADPPPGFKRVLVQKRLDPETLPDIRLAMAEGRLRFHSGHVLMGPQSPPVDFQVEDVLRGDSETLKKMEEYYGVIGNFWEREP